MAAYFPGPFDLAEALLVLLVFASLIVVGAAAGGRGRRSEFDPLVGWAVLCLPFVVLGTLTTISFLWIDALSLILLAASCLACLWRGIRIEWKAWTPYVVLALPFLLFVAPTDTYGWDQLSHWLPNTHYLASNQHFPGEGRPASTSMHAGYPYGFALATYWVEMLARLVACPTKTVGIAAALNVLFFVVAARMLVEKIRDLYGTEVPEKKAPLGTLLFAENIWLAAGLSLLAMTALSPTFLPTNSISASADNPSSIVLLAIAFSIVPSPVEDHLATNRIQIALLLVLAVYLKEDNAVPAIALLMGRIVRDTSTRQRPFHTLREFAVASLPMLAIAVLWHTYVYLHIPQGEMALRPPSQWRVDLLPRILVGIAGVLISKIGFFVCLTITTICAGKSLYERRHDDTKGAFAVIAASGFVGYTLFLAFAYVGIFAEGEAERQAAFWRYETHLGLVLESTVILLASGIGVRWRPFYGRLAIPVVAVMLLAPILLAPVIRPDLDPQSRALRAIGREVDAQLQGARELAVVDQFGNGAPCPMFVYESATPLRLAECVTKIVPCKACMIRRAAAEQSFIWSNGWSTELAQATKLQLAANASYLLKRTEGKWSAVATWPKVPTKIRGVRAIWQSS